jgi:putative transposase
MPRNVRIEYPGAVYHVMCRGDRREDIFQSDDDRRTMLDTLKQVCERTGFIVHGYVLMPNHYHLLLETPEPNLVAGMKWFQGTYTQRVNRRQGGCGHLFQGRYKALPVESEDGDYFVTVSDYIHLNPARAGLLPGGDWKAFPWSSAPAFVSQSELPRWLCRKRLFDHLSLPDQGRGSRRRYAAHISRRTQEALSNVLREEVEKGWQRIRRGWFVGSEAFRDRLMDRADEIVRQRNRDSYMGDGLGAHDERSAERRLDVARTRLGLSIGELRKLRQNDPVKQATAWWIKCGTTVSDRWICQKLLMGSRVNVSRAVRSFHDPEGTQRKKLKQLFTCSDRNL